MDLKEHATAADVKKLAHFLTTNLQEQANLLSIGHKHPEGREVWTKALWTTFERLRKELGPGWKLYPDVIGQGQGRARGEYLVDFMLMDDKRGPRIACESELGDVKAINWAFDKLRGVKSDIKVLFFESEFAEDGGMLPQIENFVKGYLAPNGQIYEAEHYLMLQFAHTEFRVFVWEAPARGPFAPEQIEFKLLVKYGDDR